MHQLVARSSIDRPARHVRSAAATLWTKICQTLADRRQPRVTAILYSALSRLSDADLEHRGIPRNDLRRFCASRAFSAGVRD
jgi:hypothetical protein